MELIEHYGDFVIYNSPPVEGLTLCPIVVRYKDRVTVEWYKTVEEAKRDIDRMPKAEREYLDWKLTAY